MREPPPSSALRWDPTLAPAGSRFVTLTSGSTRYDVAGPEDGPPVILVHGMTYPLEVWSGVWSGLIEAGLRVCRYDLPGRGFSSFDGSALTRARLVEQLLELIAASKLGEPVSLVGLSNADLILTEAARRAPSLIRRLVCVAPSGWDRRTMSGQARWVRELPLVRGRVQASLRERCAQRMEGHRAHLPSHTPVEIREAYALSIRSARESPAFAAAVQSQLGNLPRRAELQQSLTALADHALPVTLLRFRSEADATDEGVRWLRDYLPAVDEVTLEGTHMGLLEEPRAVTLALLHGLRR